MFNIFRSNKFFTCSKHNYTGINSPCPDCGLVEAGVMQKIADIADKSLTQWKLHIEENAQADIRDITHLEALQWKKLNAELMSIKSNFSA